MDTLHTVLRTIRTVAPLKTTVKRRWIPATLVNWSAVGQTS